MAKRLLASLGIAAALVFALAWTVEMSSPSDVVTAIVADLDDDRQLSVSTLENTLAFEQIARFVLGRQVRSLNPDDQARFAEAYRRHVKDLILHHAQRFEPRAINIVSERARRPGDMIIETQVELDGEDTAETVRWRLLLIDETWKLVDIQVAGAWLAIEQRAQIAALFDRHGGNLDAVLETFQRP